MVLFEGVMECSAVITATTARHQLSVIANSNAELEVQANNNTKKVFHNIYKTQFIFFFKKTFYSCFMLMEEYVQLDHSFH